MAVNPKRWWMNIIHSLPSPRNEKLQPKQVWFFFILSFFLFFMHLICWKSSYLLIIIITDLQSTLIVKTNRKVILQETGKLWFCGWPFVEKFVSFSRSDDEWWWSLCFFLLMWWLVNWFWSDLCVVDSNDWFFFGCCWVRSVSDDVRANLSLVKNSTFYMLLVSLNVTIVSAVKWIFIGSLI